MIKLKANLNYTERELTDPHKKFAKETLDAAIEIANSMIPLVGFDGVKENFQSHIEKGYVKVIKEEPTND